MTGNNGGKRSSLSSDSNHFQGGDQISWPRPPAQPPFYSGLHAAHLLEQMPRWENMKHPGPVPRARLRAATLSFDLSDGLITLLPSSPGIRQSQRSLRATRGDSHKCGEREVAAESDGSFVCSRLSLRGGTRLHPTGAAGGGQLRVIGSPVLGGEFPPELCFLSARVTQTVRRKGEESEDKQIGPLSSGRTLHVYLLETISQFAGGSSSHTFHICPSCYFSLRCFSIATSSPSAVIATSISAASNPYSAQTHLYTTPICL
ncbi:unnamed protein product [Pleuronectes platessa]|uniref:Uncharacterized protein n=1 Tax=Pleuronectes platessa TaxID=8262 RepID=A0A9N7ZAB5_PLEPL|nr:unnamed protein product [Pleuronectes platessa]